MPITVPKAPPYKRISYADLKGVDVSVDPSLVDKRHSPDLLNMISDNGGLPVKRKGWEVVATADSGIDNLWTFTMNGKRWFAVSNGSKLQELSNGTLIDSGITVNGGKKLGFYAQTPAHNGLFVMDKTKYYKATGDSSLDISEVDPYVPLIIISRSPTGGGVVYEGINMLTRQRKEQFLNSGSKTFLVTSQVDTTRPWKFEYKNANGDWVTANATVSGATFTVSTVYDPVVSGQDNISITYYATGTGNPEIDKSSRVLGCQTHAHYSKSTVDQIFVTGNPDYPQYVFYSGLGDPTYFPDLNYLYIGGASTSVMGFLNLGEYLAVVKEQSGQDSTVFLIYQTSISSKTVTIDDKTVQTTQETTYATKQATTGIGAISRHCFGVLNDEPMFFSANGIHGIVSTSLTSEKVTRNRSTYLDRKLTQEPGLENAVAVVWNNYYCLAINDHMYVLDGRHKTNDRMGNTNYLYEGYFWDNIPAKCLMTFGKELWFGTADGRICRFKTGTDMTVYSDDGAPIRAVWSTPLDDDGAPEYYKTMQKKGSMCTFAPFPKSSVDVYIEIDGNPRLYIGSSAIDIGINFATIDFSNFTFDARTTPRDKFFGKKIKKYKRMKIILENNKVDEGFGVHSITKTIAYTRYAK
jgi:hypothetical protein